MIRLEDETMADRIALEVCRDVGELPDRTSPEDWPEAMLVTHDELRWIVTERLHEALGAYAISAHTLAERVLQAPEWGYRDPTGAGFVEHNLPFELAAAVLGRTTGVA